MSISVSIILLNYNTLSFTEECIKSIIRNTSSCYEIIVVDNNSNDKEKIKMLEKKYNSVKVIVNEVNLGFGAGNNLGVKFAQGKFVVILNNDTIVYSETIDNAVKFLDNYGYKTVVTGLIEDSNGNNQHSGGKEPKFLAELLRFGFMLIKYVPNSYYDKYYFVPHNDSPMENIDWASGCFFVMYKEFYDKLGGFDEKMFMYVEDVEFSKRVRLNGGRIIFYPGIKIKHFGSQTSKHYKDSVLKSQYKNTIYYFKKHSNLFLVILFYIFSKTLFFFWYLLFSFLKMLPFKNISKYNDKKRIYKNLLNMN